MSKQKLKGLWIPAKILLNNDLSDKEKIILSMILYLSDETGSCFASNKYIASIVNVTSDRVSKIVSSLKEKGYVDVNLKYKIDTKEIEERQIIPIAERINRYSKKYLEGIGKNNYSDSQKELHPIGENDKDIRKSYNKLKDKEDFLVTDVEHKEQGRVIINNIKNKNNYNKESQIKKNNKANFEQRDYTGFDFTKLYANADAFL
ncbi:MAG: helix-turn-helix domain-containing protein [Clostridia bacterium]|nr:helix-turn-helix domain-containing protein [Clostridia bacterium]